MLDAVGRVIYDFNEDSNEISEDHILIFETYELENIDSGMLEAALETFALKFPNAVIRVSGDGDDAGSVWRFEAECKNGHYSIKKSKYYYRMLIGDYSKDDYEGFIKWEQGEGMSLEEFERFKEEGHMVVYRPADGSKAFCSVIPLG